MFHISVTAPMVAQTICNNDQIIKAKSAYLQQLINLWALDKTGNLTKEQVDGKIKFLMDEIHPELPKPREGQHFKYVTLIFHISVTAPMVAQTICNNDQIIKRKASYLQQLINSWALDKTGNLTKEQVDGKIKSRMDEIQELKTQNYKNFISLPSDYRPKRE